MYASIFSTTFVWNILILRRTELEIRSKMFKWINQPDAAISQVYYLSFNPYATNVIYIYIWSTHSW